MDDQDLRWAASSMIRLFGRSAAMEAAMMADKMQARKDAEGWDIWQRISGAIRALDKRRMPGALEQPLHH
jgi:hypothetical protein